MRLIAVKPLYQVKEGATFETTAMVGRLIVLMGLGREIPDPVAEAVPEDRPARRRGTYRRRDLQAEQVAEVTVEGASTDPRGE